MNIEELVEFRLEANKKTYAAKENQVKSTRLDSVDFNYKNGDYEYHDTYVGGIFFAGEEAISYKGKTIYAMNYVGRNLNNDLFSGDFLKEALLLADINNPYRGPKEYVNGNYRYTCEVEGDINWFNGYEAIYFKDELIYELRFNGLITK